MSTVNPSFIIGALPRSGTAWFSTAFNTVCTGLCVHEGLGRYLSSGVPPVCDPRGSERVWGTCGSDALVPGVIPDGYKGAVYWIERDEEACRRSLVKCGVYNEGAWFLQLKWKHEFLSRYKPTIIPYEQLVGGLILVAFNDGCTLDWGKLQLVEEVRIVSRRWPDSVNNNQCEDR